MLDRVLRSGDLASRFLFQSSTFPKGARVDLPLRLLGLLRQSGVPQLWRALPAPGSARLGQQYSTRSLLGPRKLLVSPPSSFSILRMGQARPMPHLARRPMAGSKPSSLSRRLPLRLGPRRFPYQRRRPLPISSRRTFAESFARPNGALCLVRSRPPSSFKPSSIAVWPCAARPSLAGHSSGWPAPHGEAEGRPRRTRGGPRCRHRGLRGGQGGLARGQAEGTDARTLYDEAVTA